MKKTVVRRMPKADCSGDLSADQFLKALTKNGKMRRLSKEETQVLCEKYAAGDQQAREDLILHNIPLVVHIVKRMRFVFKHASLADLISLGIAGLIDGINHLDGRESKLLSPYIGFYIEGAIREIAVESCTHVHAPRAMHDIIRKLIWLRRGEQLTTVDVIDQSDLTDEYKGVLKRLLYDVVSVYDPISCDSVDSIPETLADVLPAHSSSDPYEYKHFFDIQNTFDKAGLDETEKAMMIYRFAFDDELSKQRPIKKVAEKFGLQTVECSEKLTACIEKLRVFLKDEFDLIFG